MKANIVSRGPGARGRAVMVCRYSHFWGKLDGRTWASSGGTKTGPAAHDWPYPVVERRSDTGPGKPSSRWADFDKQPGWAKLYRTVANAHARKGLETILAAAQNLLRYATSR